MPDVTRHAPTQPGFPVPEQEAHRERMLAEIRKMPKVDQNGRTIQGPDPSVIDFVPEPAAPPTLAGALSAAADLVPGADLQQLLDSQSFCAELGEISPSDSLGLQDVIRRHTPDPMPGMAPNRAQGASNASAAGRSTGSSADQIHALVAARLSR